MINLCRLIPMSNLVISARVPLKLFNNATLKLKLDVLQI